MSTGMVRESSGVSDIAVVGIGEVPTARMPERTHWDIIFDTCIEAVEDSGIGKDEIQGVISVAPVGQPVIAGELAFGLGSHAQPPQRDDRRDRRRPRAWIHEERLDLLRLADLS